MTSSSLPEQIAQKLAAFYDHPRNWELHANNAKSILVLVIAEVEKMTPKYDDLQDHTSNFKAGYRYALTNVKAKLGGGNG